MEERLTKRQAAIIGAFTGYACGPFADIQEYAEELFGHPIWTHEFANKQFSEDLRVKAKPDFIKICHEVSA